MSFATRWEYTHDPGFAIAALGGETMTTLARLWVTYFFKIRDDDHPHSHREWTHTRRKFLDGNQATTVAHPPDVWHLLEGNIGGFYKTFLPPLPGARDWSIMFSTYVTLSSTFEFPSIPLPADLKRFAKDDTDSVYRNEALINDERLTPIRIADSVKTQIAANSVLENTGASPPGEQVFFDGYFVLLKPLPLGETRIESRGYSPNYVNDVKYIVYKRR